VFFPPTGTGNIGYVCGWSGTILATTNAGINWSLQASGTTQNLRSMHFPNAQTGWAVGDNGTILKTTTGGVTPVVQVSAEYPLTFDLYQNYPNPFNPATKIRFQLPEQSIAVLKIFDVLGNEIQVLLNRQLSAGFYDIEFNAGDMPSGVYYYRLNTGEFKESKKMVIIK
jgi:hypothetical protein